ncbi:hypothetical protein TNCV_4071191 [Trichonephila clavipes]|nr:hypothetical protein TNCV_4071191 [Trichonephila clavipes]
MWCTTGHDMDDSCRDALGQIDVLPRATDRPEESRGYQQCLPNYCSANVCSGCSLTADVWFMHLCLLLFTGNDGWNLPQVLQMDIH